MADTKISAQTAFSGLPLATDIMPFVRDPGGTPLSRKLTFADLMNRQVGHNVLAYGAVGDYNEGADTGTNDTTAIQAAYTAASAAGGSGLVIFPGLHKYKITSTINVPHGTWTVGMGSLNAVSGPTPPTVFWRGSGGGAMFQQDNAGQNTAATRFENLKFAGGINMTTANWAGKGIYFSGGGLDTGTIIRECWFGFLDNGIQIDQGVTNAYIIGGRFDRLTGYAIKVLMDSGNVYMQVHDITYDNWDAGADNISPYAQGFMFIDGEAADGTIANLHLTGFHLEVNGYLADTYAAGTNPADKRGLIRLGINPATNVVQHMIQADSFSISAAGATKSHSLFQCTSASGTLQQHIDRIAIVLHQGYAVAKETTSDVADLGTTKLLGNVPTLYENQDGSRLNVTQFIRSGTPSVYARVPRSDIFQGLPQMHGGIYFRPLTVAQLPANAFEGMVCMVTNATATTRLSTVAGGGTNNVLVVYDGANWVIV